MAPSARIVTVTEAHKEKLLSSFLVFRLKWLMLDEN